MRFALSVLGVVLIIEGIPYLAMPGKAKNWAMVLQEMPLNTLRVLGFFSMMTGLLLLYVAGSL